MRELENNLKAWFEWFHRNPELSYEEFGTTAKIREILESVDGISLASCGLETGLVATIEGALPGAAQGLRCDIDALPIQERSGLAYASVQPEKMHACGHDFHVTAGVGTALLLASRRQELRGTVRIIFQPAEEASQGGLELVRSNPAVLDGMTRIWGLHADPTLPVGSIGVRAGYVAAAVDRFRIHLTGKGGHGARPHECIDPIPAAASLALALQTILTRNISPFHPALLSVTRISAGNTWNVIPTDAELEGTVRTLDRSDRALYEARLRELAEETAKAYRLQANVEWIPGPPAVDNDADMAACAAKQAEKLGLCVEVEEQSMTGDDFSAYTENIPGCYIKIGTGVGPTIHQPDFKVDERVLLPSAQYLAELLLSQA